MKADQKCACCVQLQVLILYMWHCLARLQVPVGRTFHHSSYQCQALPCSTNFWEAAGR